MLFSISREILKTSLKTLENAVFCEKNAFFYVGAAKIDDCAA